MKKNRLCKVFAAGMYPHHKIFQFLCCCVILAAVFQPATLKAYENPNEVNFESQNFQTQTAQHQDIRELKPGETVERQANVNDVHAYQISLEAGKAVIVTIPQRAVSFIVEAIRTEEKDYNVPGQKIPAGKVFASGSPTVPIALVSDTPRTYIIKLRFHVAGGSYLISCDNVHSITEKDRKYDSAQRLYQEALQPLDINQRLNKFEERLAIYRSLDDKGAIAHSLASVADALSAKAELIKAVNYAREALELSRSLNNVEDRLGILSRLGALYITIGNYEEAINSYSEVLSSSLSHPDKGWKVNVLHQLGVVYHLLADEQKARDFYEQSLMVARSIDPPTQNSFVSQATTLINIGNLYRGVGANEIVIDAFGSRTIDDRQKALEYYKQALENAVKAKTLFPNVMTKYSYTLLLIGNTYKELGNYSEALKYINQSLEGYKASKGLPGLVYGYMALGNLYALKGENQKCFENYEQAITLLRQGVDDRYQAEYFNIIARDYYRAGEAQKALDLLGESFTLSRAREQQGVSAAALFETARIERDLGNFNTARNRIEEALQIVELLRARITSQDVRTTYFSTVKRYYDFYVDLLMQAHKSQPEKGFDALALQMGEKARSRSLLDLLTLSKVDIRHGVDSALLESEKSLRERLTEKANQQTRLLLGKHTKEEAEKNQREIDDLTNQYQAIQTQIKNKSPRYAALTQPVPLNARQIQQLLDSGTVLLEYSLGEKKSYLWVVSADSIKSFDLPGREEVEAQARKVYELLTARNQHPNDEAEPQRRARITAAEAEYPKAAGKLTRMLLGQAAAEIGSKRLLIVPDGALNYLPFSALPSPNAQTTVNQWQPLGMNNEIINLPSASVLALLRQETTGRKPAPKMLAVYADPVFSPNDSRLAKNTNAGKTGETSQSNNKAKNLSTNRDLERAAENVGLISREAAGGLPRLAFSRREADSIYNVSAKNLSLKALDFKASKSEILNSNVDQYRILHFATHGLLDSQRPELSGIVLSLLDEKGNERDGFLRLQDIYNLKLSADLVVLSACNTALGKDVKGEGLIGLTRGFMYAGAPRMAASLWMVDDAATAELMSLFYRKMLAENLRPAAALRAAQIEMMKQSRWKSPYYWAPFVIQGEWK